MKKLKSSRNLAVRTCRLKINFTGVLKLKLLYTLTALVISATTSTTTFSADNNYLSCNKSAEQLNSSVHAMHTKQIDALNKFNRVEQLSLSKSCNPYTIKGNLGIFDKSDMNKSIEKFHDKFSELFQLNDKSQFSLISSVDGKFDTTHIRLNAKVGDIPIYSGQVILTLDDANTIVSIESNFPPTKNLNLVAEINVDSLLDILVQHYKNNNTLKQIDTPKLIIRIDHNDNGNLVWKTKISYLDESQFEQIETAFIDATTGQFIASIPDHKNFFYTTVIHDGSLSGRVIPQSEYVTDTLAANLDRNLTHAWNYFDGHGRPGYNFGNWRDRLVNTTTHNAIIHFGTNYNNAFWSSYDQAWYFGDGDGQILSPIGNALDVVVHEYTHAVIDYTANLVYNAESGAINESISDIFAAHAENISNSKYPGWVTSTAWQIGESIFTPNISGDAFRYMNNPTLDNYSKDFYPERFDTTPPCDRYNDFCGVHSNSGIVNLAFYLLSEGGTHPQGKTLNNVVGIGIEKAADIVYGALDHRLLPTDDFEQMRYKMAEEAISLYGDGQEKLSVCEAWDAVGIPGENMGVCL